MKICQNCGKEVAEDFKYCNSCGAEVEDATDENVDVESTENTVEQSDVNVYQNVQPADSNDEYLPLISKSKNTNLLSIGLLAVGVISLLFINGWLGAVLCFVAEIVALIPNTKVQKLFKSKNPTMDKKSFKTNLKELQNDLKAKNKEFKTSFLIAIIALVALVLCLVIPSPVTAMFESEPTESPSIEENDGVIEDNDDNIENNTTDKPTDNSEQGSSNNHSTEPVIGSFDYSEMRYMDTMESLTISLPYISHINFNADGTGNLTQKTNTSRGFALYTTTWEIVESTDNITKYAVYTNTNETIYIFYDYDMDLCSMYGTKNGRNVAIFYKRYSGNAQENMSGGTAITAHDVIGSYSFSHAYNSDTEYKTTTPSAPYPYSLAFYDGNSCLVTTKTVTDDLDFRMGSWKYEKPVGEYLAYTITLSQGTTMSLFYLPDDEMCAISAGNGMYYYFEKDKD